MSRFNGWTSAAALDVKINQQARQAKASKYRNRKIQVDGMMFDSKAEARHYGYLKLARDAGHLEFERQVAYRLEINGKLICTYKADFVVKFKDGRVEVQDVKGVRTKEYLLKKKLMSALYGIEIREIK